jgi:hypothetical protein
MSKPQTFKGINWQESSEKLLETIALNYGDTMRLLDIPPYTNVTGKKKPNASGIILFALMVLAGKVDRVTVDQDAE